MYDKYVVVPADKTLNNMCKSHHIDCLITELGIANTLDNRTYTPMTLTKEEILDNDRPAFCSFQMMNLFFCHSTGYLNCITIS